MRRKGGCLLVDVNFSFEWIASRLRCTLCIFCLLYICGCSVAINFLQVKIRSVYLLTSLPLVSDCRRSLFLDLHFTHQWWPLLSSQCEDLFLINWRHYSHERDIYEHLSIMNRCTENFIPFSIDNFVNSTSQGRMEMNINGTIGSEKLTYCRMTWRYFRANSTSFPPNKILAVKVQEVSARSWPSSWIGWKMSIQIWWRILTSISGLLTSRSRLVILAAILLQPPKWSTVIEQAIK